MGSAGSVVVEPPFPDAPAALAAGHSQDEVDAWKQWAAACPLKQPAAATQQPSSASSSSSLIQDLFEGPIDVVGDVHGECGTLCQLLDRLGYDGDGNHPEKRRLVFVGDLVDRGPDSPGVVRLVRHLVQTKKTAQCILGNHELNIIRGDHKHGNGWYYGQPEVIRKDKGGISFQVLAKDDAERADVKAFFEALPLALMRRDAVVVHAAWDPGSVRKIQAMEAEAGAKEQEGEAKGDGGGGGGGGVLGVAEIFKRFEAATAKKIADEGIEDKDEVDMLEQNGNPVKVLSSGLEGKAPEPFFAGGKMRTLERVKWWEDYDPTAKAGEGGEGGEDDTSLTEGKLVVIGHFWRRFMGEIDPRVGEKHPEGFAPTGADMFPQYQPQQLLGKAKAVMCVDYAAGVRYEERGMALPESALGTQLAALRLPERELRLADGRIIPCE